MQHATKDLKDPERERSTATPIKSEFAEIIQQAVAADGFSLEWVFDRYEHAGGRA